MLIEPEGINDIQFMPGIWMWLGDLKSKPGQSVCVYIVH